MTGARVVASPTTTLESATVVLRDGRIEAVGANVRVPAGARIWDLAGRVVVGFSVSSRDEVDGLYGEMTAAGHRGLQAPFDAFWGARYAIVEDPDGIAVGIMSPISAKHRAPPPEV